MRKVILCLAVSFDGYIEGPNGEIDWIVFDKEGGSDLTSFIKEIDTVFYGRVSYEMWGSPEINENSSEFEKSFYGELNKMDKYVFSTTKTDFEEQVYVVKDDIPPLVKKIKSTSGKHIWLYGGASLISTFANLDLIDELRIAIMPVIIGKGKPLFKEIERRIRLKLVNVAGSPSGVIKETYQVVR